MSVSIDKPRVNFASVKNPLPYPDFLEVQLKSFQDFLQLDTPPEKRNNEGLYKVFAENFPIADTRNNFVLEFYIDRFLPMLTTGVDDRFPLLHTLAKAWDHEIRDILGMAVCNAEASTEGPIREDHPRHNIPDITADILLPYRQVRQDKLGFLGGLSILDLIFNLGPEAQIYLNNAAKKAYKQDTCQCE